MHIPKAFEIADQEEVMAFIQANAFGQLISNSNGQIVSSHIPFLLSDDQQTLFAHMAINNTQLDGLDGQEMLITLEGAHDYISPSWYEAGGVPTWNYQAVHIYGTAKTFNDTDRLKVLVDGLSAKYEAQFERPWQPDYKAAMLKAIVGVEVSINDIQCKYKFSQNKSFEDQANVIQQLRKLGSEQLADEMERILFP